ncbi:MAG: threonine dehydratase [Gammaproteobacteria bacterium]|nr:threonine dehydratase [Gammaproteobacteria bacterium]NNF60209.1 threonine dehydratase [Gammaproteobacteria bacterium]
MLNSTQSSDESFEEDVATPGLTLQDVYSAQEVIGRQLPATPLVGHPLLSQALGCEARVKLENTHAIGSFKIRGGLNLLATMPDAERERGLVTATRGNHGQSVAYAARQHGARCTIFVPEGNNEDKNAAMAALGADVVVAGHDFDAAWAASERFARDTGARSVHPAREQALVAGVGTLALEMIEQAQQPFDVVFVPVGGGSIAAACAVVFKALSPTTRVIGVQAENAPAQYHAWHSGEHHPFAVTETVADGLAVRVPVESTMDVMRELLDDMLLVSEDEIYAAIRCYAATVHQMAEGAGAVPLAGAMQLRTELAGHHVGLVLTGGNIESHTLIEALNGGLPVYRPQAMPMYPIAELDYGCR